MDEDQAAEPTGTTSASEDDAPESSVDAIDTVSGDPVSSNSDGPSENTDVQPAPSSEEEIKKEYDMALWDLLPLITCLPATDIQTSLIAVSIGAYAFDLSWEVARPNKKKLSKGRRKTKGRVLLISLLNKSGGCSIMLRTDAGTYQRQPLFSCFFNGEQMEQLHHQDKLTMVDFSVMNIELYKDQKSVDVTATNENGQASLTRLFVDEPTRGVLLELINNIQFMYPAKDPFIRAVLGEYQCQIDGATVIRACPTKLGVLFDNMQPSSFFMEYGKWLNQAASMYIEMTGMADNPVYAALRRAVAAESQGTEDATATLSSVPTDKENQQDPAESEQAIVVGADTV